MVGVIIIGKPLTPKRNESEYLPAVKWWKINKDKNEKNADYLQHG